MHSALLPSSARAAAPAAVRDPVAAAAADAFRSSGQSPGVAAPRVALPAPFRLASGAALPAPVVAFERFGARGAPTVAVLGGISAHRRVAASAAGPGWWQEVVGDGRGIDTARVGVLAFDWLGGAGGSTSPAAGEAFPSVDAADQARALWHLCDALGIERLHGLVGSSYGGMVALHAARLAPERVARLAVIAAAHEGHAQARAWRHVQRGIVELGRRHRCGAEALALARALAMTTYRSPRELTERFGAADDGALGGWLDARGSAFAGAWNPEQFLCLSRSIDAHRIDPGSVPVPTWLLAFDSDQLVPPESVHALARALPDLRGHQQLHSPYGHDAFLKEPRRVAAFLREVLR